MKMKNIRRKLLKGLLIVLCLGNVMQLNTEPVYASKKIWKLSYEECPLKYELDKLEWQFIDGLYLDENGPVDGWREINEKWYYFDEGTMYQNKWLCSTKWYYFDELGEMATMGMKTIDQFAMFEENGHWVPEGYKLDVEGNVPGWVIESYKKEIENLPFFLKVNAKSYVLVNGSLEDRLNMQRGGVIGGVYTNEHIYLRADTYYSNSGMVLHESIHAYDANQKNGAFSASMEFRTAYSNDYLNIPFEVGNYKNEAEAFVQCSLLYMRDKNSLKNRCPNIYSYFSETVYNHI